MRDSLLRERVIDEDTIESTVDTSVVNWLMHVISGKQPIEMHLNDAAAVEAAPKAVAPEPETVKIPIAAEQLPREEQPVSIESQNHIFTVTAEDLCGAPLFPIAPLGQEIKSARDEITAEDLCFVPKAQQAEPNGAVDTARIPGPQLVQLPKEEVAVADANRKVASVFFEPEGTATVLDIFRDPNEQAAESEDHEIAPVDIVRDQEIYKAKPKAAEEVDWLPETHSASVTAAPSADMTSAPAIVDEARLHVVEPEASANVVDAVANEMQAQPEFVESAVAAAEAVSGPSLDAQQIEPIVAESVAPPMEAAQQELYAAWSAFVNKEDLRGVELMAFGQEANGIAEPAHAPEPQEAEQQVEHAVNGSAAGERFDIQEPNFYSQSGHRETVPVADDKYREQFFEESGKGYPVPEFLKEMDSRPEGWVSAWKALIRLGTVLPWVARQAPTFDGGLVSEQQNTGLSEEVREEVAGLRMVQYEIKSTVQDHSLQLKRLEDQITRVRESVESDSGDSAVVIENMKSTVRLVRMVGIGLGSILLVLIVMVGLVLAHGR